MQERQRTRSSRERLQLIFHLSFLHGRNPSAAERLITVREQQAIGAAERAKDARKFSHGTVIIPHTADGGETAGLHPLLTAFPGAGAGTARRAERRPRRCPSPRRRPAAVPRLPAASAGRASPPAAPRPAGRAARAGPAAPHAATIALLPALRRVSPQPGPARPAAPPTVGV